MDNIVQMVSTVGFPIIACLGLAWYVKYCEDKNKEEVRELNKQHTEEISIFRDEIKEALNNNTIAITKLCEKIEFRSEVIKDENE